MSAKGGDYLVVLSIGGTIFLFLPCLGEATREAMVTVVSQMLGKQQYSLLNRALRSGTLLVSILTALFIIPFLVYPSTIFHHLFPGLVLQDSAIHLENLGS